MCKMFWIRYIFTDISVGGDKLLTLNIKTIIFAYGTLFNVCCSRAAIFSRRSIVTFDKHPVVYFSVWHLSLFFLPLSLYNICTGMINLYSMFWEKASVWLFFFVLVFYLYLSENLLIHKRLFFSNSHFIGCYLSLFFSMCSDIIQEQKSRLKDCK